MTDFDRARQGWQNRIFERPGMALRAAFWNVENPRGQILLLGGLRDFAEKNTAEAETFARWGFSTVFLDWHHQGRSGRLSGVNPAYAHTTDFSEYDADLATLWPHIHPTVAVAHSMGAHNALRFWIKEQVTLPLVLTAPLMGAQLGMPEPLARFLARLAVALGRGPYLAPGQLVYARPPFENNIYSRDPARFAEMFDWMEHDPAVQKDGATFGWVYAFLRSAAWLRQPAVLQKVKAPVLAFMTPNDPLINGPAEEVLSRYVPHITVERLPDCTHEPLRDEARIRDKVMEKIRLFAEQAGSQPPL